jgi:hypothetical protein
VIERAGGPGSQFLRLDLYQREAVPTRRTLEPMTHIPRGNLWFVLSLIWLAVLLAAIPFVFGIW